MMMPTPICRKKELVAELIRGKALLYMGTRSRRIAVVVERFKERPDTDLVDIDGISIASGKATKAWSLARAVLC